MTEQHRLARSVRHYADAGTVVFSKLPKERVYHRPEPGKWSAVEIIGHLADSARYNLQRFTEAGYQGGRYTFAAYAQDYLVARNAYQQQPLESVVTLWSALNHQITHVVLHLPDSALRTVCSDGGTEELTLSELIEGYVQHDHHHLRQLEPQ